MKVPTFYQKRNDDEQYVLVNNIFMSNICL